MPALAQVSRPGIGLDLDQPVTSRLLDVLDHTELSVTRSILPARGLSLGARLPVLALGRYVSLREPEGPGDALRAELELITTRGYAVWLVQHVLHPGWEASAQLGADLGGAASDNALSAGYAPTSHLGLDLEGTISKGDAVLAFVEAWAEEVTRSFPVLLYVGYDNGLTPHDLYFGLGNVHLYWGAPGPWDVAERHFAIRQGLSMTMGGVEVDPDGIGEDALGGRLTWMVDPAAMSRRLGSDRVS